MTPKRTVLFLGAGASYPLGYPVTEGILPAIWKGLTDDAAWQKWAGLRDNAGAAEEAENLRRFLALLFPGLEDGAPEIRGASIVDVISMLDQLLAEGRSLNPEFDEEGLRRARLTLSKGINGVLQGLAAQDLRQDLAAWVIDHASRLGRVTVASTNYDTAVEQAIYNALGPGNVPAKVDFGVPWRDPGKDAVHLRPTAASIGVFKLHGSLNWLRCETCGFVYVNPLGRIAPQGFQNARTDYNTCDCGGRLRIVMVTPSVVRDVRDANLLGIWNATLEDLRRADEWVLVGYSLPPEDIAIRSLLLRAFHTRTANELRVLVVQFERPEVRERSEAGEYTAEYARYRLFFPKANLREEDYRRDGVEAFVRGLSG